MNIRINGNDIEECVKLVEDATDRKIPESQAVKLVLDLGMDALRMKKVPLPVRKLKPVDDPWVRLQLRSRALMMSLLHQ